MNCHLLKISIFWICLFCCTILYGQENGHVSKLLNRGGISTASVLNHIRDSASIKTIVDFGAIANDGLSDKVAIDAAIVYSQSGEQNTVYVPNGRFDLDSTEAFTITEGLTLFLEEGAYIYHDSKISTSPNFIVLESNTKITGGKIGSSSDRTLWSGGGMPTSNVIMIYTEGENVIIDGVKIGHGLYGIQSNGAQNIKINNVTFDTCSTSALLIDTNGSISGFHSDRRSTQLGNTGYHHLYLNDSNIEMANLRLIGGGGDAIKLNHDTKNNAKETNIVNVALDSCGRINFTTGISLNITNLDADSCGFILQGRNYSNVNISNVNVVSNGSTIFLNDPIDASANIIQMNITGLNIFGTAQIMPGKVDYLTFDGGSWYNFLRPSTDLDPIHFASGGATNKKTIFSNITFVQDSTHAQDDIIDSPFASAVFVDFVNCNFKINSGTITNFGRVKSGSRVRLIGGEYSSTEILAFLLQTGGYGGVLHQSHHFNRSTGFYITQEDDDSSFGLTLDAITVAANGNIGINRTVPESKLTVYGEDLLVKNTAGVAQVLLQAQSSNLWQILANTDNTLIWKNTTSPAMYFNNGSNFAGINYTSKRLGMGRSDPESTLHSYDNSTGVGVNTGVTIEQAGTGDAILQWFLTGGQRFVVGIDNSDSDKLKMAYSTDLNTNAAFTMDTSGNVGLATTAPTAVLDVNSNIIRLRIAKTPSSASDTGNTGDLSWDADYIYVCVATNTWKRVAIATW